MNQQPIFGSLGSNYSTEFVRAALNFMCFPPNGQTIATQWQSEVRKLYPQSTLPISFFLQGRQALEMALKAYGIGSGGAVLTQAFSCSSVVDAVTKTGAAVVLVDTEPGSTNCSLAELQAAAQRSPLPVTAVILQYSLGVMLDEKAVAQWCKQNNIILVSDLAQGFGCTTLEGDWAGTHADVLVLSFGRDKILDGVIGGAVVCQKHARFPELLQPFHTLTQERPVKTLLYPLLTMIIRTTWNWLLLGRGIFWIARRLGMIWSPVIDASHDCRRLSSAHAALALKQLKRVHSQLEQRKQCLERYQAAFAEYSQVPARWLAGSCGLRFPLRVSDPARLVKTLAAAQIYLADRWYTRPLDSGRVKSTVQYKQGSCPVTESLCGEILNLPTHQGMTSEQVERIVRLVKAAV